MKPSDLFNIIDDISGKYLFELDTEENTNKYKQELLAAVGTTNEPSNLLIYATKLMYFLTNNVDSPSVYIIDEIISVMKRYKHEVGVCSGRVAVIPREIWTSEDPEKLAVFKQLVSESKRLGIKVTLL